MAEENQSPGLMSPASSMAVSMIDRFTNPAAYYEEAKKKGIFTIVPGKIPQKEEVEKLKISVPEKLENIDNPYLPKKAKQKLIEKYKKGEGFAQKFQLAFPAIFEVPQIDLLLPAPGPTGAVGSRPILSNWFKSKTSGKSNLEREFDANSIQSLLNTSDISKNQQKKEILQKLIDDFTAERKAATGFFENLGFIKPTEKKVTGADFEQYVLKRIAALQAEMSPSISTNKELTSYLTNTGLVFEPMAVTSGGKVENFTSKAGTIEQNPSAIAVGYEGVHPFYYSKGMGDEFEHTAIAGEFPQFLSEIKTLPKIEPTLGYFGHFRKLNIKEDVASKLEAYNPTIAETMFAFEIQQDLFKPYKLAVETSTGRRTVYATPTTLETQVYILLNKALSTKFNERMKSIVGDIKPERKYIKSSKDGDAYSAHGLQEEMKTIIKEAEVSEPSHIFNMSIKRFMDDFREKIYSKYYFKEGQVNPNEGYINPNFIEEVNKLDPYSFFNEVESNLLKQEFPLTLNEKIISVSGKNKDTIATGLIIEAAIKKAIQQGDKYVAFPTVHSAEKLQSWTLQGTNLNKYNNAITKNSKPYIKDFFLSGVGNKTTGLNYVNLYDGKGIDAFDKSIFNSMIDIVEQKDYTAFSTQKRLGLPDRRLEEPQEIDIELFYKMDKNKYLDGVVVKSTYANLETIATQSFARQLISEMEYLNLIASNKMPDAADLSIDKVFKHFIIMGKTDNVNVIDQFGKKELNIFNSVPRGGYLEIPENLREKFKNPEFLLTLGAHSANKVDNEGLDTHVTIGILRTIFNTHEPKVIYEEMSKIFEGKKAHLKAFNKNVKKEYEQLLDARDQKNIDSAGQKSISDAERIKISKYEPYVEAIDSPYMYHSDNLDKLFEGETPSYKDMESIVNELHTLQDYYRTAHNFLTRNDFFSPTFKEDMAIGYKQTNYGGLVKTYTDTIPNLFKQAGVETEIIKVPRMSIAGQAEYTDDTVEEFLRIQLTPENIKKLQEYKTNLFTNSILPRVSKEEENNKKTIFSPLSPSQKMFMNMGLLDVQLGS